MIAFGTVLTALDIPRQLASEKVLKKPIWRSQDCCRPQTPLTRYLAFESLAETPVCSVCSELRKRLQANMQI